MSEREPGPPDPAEDYEGYCLWMELTAEAHPCHQCGGCGNVCGDYDIDRECGSCDGTGISADAMPYDVEYEE